MSIQEQLIEDIKQLPYPALKVISAAVKEFLNQNNENNVEMAMENKTWTTDDFAARFPLLGCAKGKTWMVDDFNAPMEEMENYM